jgi:hypothetical protein
MIYGLDVYRDAVLWNKTFPAGVDQLASSPDGTLLYVPPGRTEPQITSRSWTQ